MKLLVARALATAFGLGERLPAPGTTAGSLPPAIAFAILLWAAPAHAALIAGAACLVIVPVAIWSAGCECRRCGLTDPGSVVVDEVAGQWIALTVVVLLGERPSLGAIAVAFLLFRLLDVTKPWPIGALERLPGGWGVCLDDVAAGLIAGALTAGIAALAG